MLTEICAFSIGYEAYHLFGGYFNDLEPVRPHKI